MTPIIEFDGVSKWYGNVIGLNKLTLHVPAGVTGLLGPNGAGKSTLLQLATGQLRPSQGTVRVQVDVELEDGQVRERVRVRDDVASVTRPVQELRGFKRVTLAPGEASRVSFRLSGPQMAVFGLNNQWRVEPGRMEVMVGSSSADIRARGEFELTSSFVTQAPAASIATAITISAVK